MGSGDPTVISLIVQQSGGKAFWAGRACVLRRRSRETETLCRLLDSRPYQCPITPPTIGFTLPVESVHQSEREEIPAGGYRDVLPATDAERHRRRLQVAAQKCQSAPHRIGPTRSPSSSAG